MKRWTIILLVILAALITGCNMPGYQTQEPVESTAQMATDIARILTGTPIEIEPPATDEPVVEEPTEEQETVEPTSPTEEEEITEEVPAESETEVPETEEPETLEPETEEPTATPEPTNTPTPEPTATLADTDPAATLGEPDSVDVMDDSGYWPTGANDYSSIEFEDGFLKLTAGTDLDGWRLNYPVLEDFYLEAVLKSPECDGDDHFGLMFRSPEASQANKGYLFGITCGGRYSLRRWDGTDMYYPVNWTESDVINQGESKVNVLGIMAKGATLTLYINGEKVNEVTDNAYLEGQFGVFVGGTNTEDLSVWVDQIRYWELP